MSKAIYTSPIKALSNQKYRDFKEKFQDGDITLNRSASCLVVTTQVLQSMLYRAAQITRDLQWVIFDEVHYINDMQRGFVWQQIIIMLPDHVSIIMLSATVPNFLDFANWVGTTKRKKVYVQMTQKRPVPLEHFIYLNNKLTLIKTETQIFLQAKYNELLDKKLKKKELDQKNRYKHKDETPNPDQEKKIDYIQKAKKAKKQALHKIASKGQKGWSQGGKLPNKHNDPKHKRFGEAISFLSKNNLLPVVIFIFSKKQIMRRAQNLSNLVLTKSGQRARILSFYQKCLRKFKECDRNLPQLLFLKDIIANGIGVHHAGLLPIVKQMVEILFSQGLIKVLLATTTFAMGVNMPARSVMFISLKRFDGQQMKALQSSQYLQMAGRAGRRGVDTTGTVVIYCDQIQNLLAMGEMRQVMRNKGDILESKFRLTYKMILFILKSESFRVQDMMKYSFGQFNNQKQNVKRTEKMKKLLQELKQMKEIECIFQDSSLIKQYSRINQQMMKVNSQIVTQISGKLIQDKRVVLVYNKDYNFDKALILSQDTKQNKLFILCLPKAPSANFISQGFTTKGESIYFEYAYISYGQVFNITSKVIKDNYDKLKSGQIASKYQDTIVSALSQLPDKLQGKQGLGQLNLKEYKVPPNISKNQKLVLSAFKGSKCHTCDLRQDHFQHESRRNTLANQISAVSKDLSEASLSTMKQFTKRLCVLQHFEFIDCQSIEQFLQYRKGFYSQSITSRNSSRNDATLLLKGKIARQVSSLDQILCTELLISNTLRDLSPQYILVMLSMLMRGQKSSNGQSPEQVLNWAYQQSQMLGNAIRYLYKATDDLLQFERQIQLQDQSQELEGRLNLNLTQIVLDWGNDKDFASICDLTQIEQGAIVRAIMRLENGCRDIKNALRVMGNSVLAEKVEKARQLIKRDIIFAPSLYIE